MGVRVAHFGVIAVAGAVFLVGGCAGTPAAPTGVGELVEGSGAALVAHDMFPPEQTRRRTAHLDPSTREVERIVTATREMLDGSSWIMHTSRDDGGEPGSGEMIFRREDDGSVVLVSLIADTPEALSDGQARYIFEPALMMTPARLEEGERFEHAADVRIVSLEDEDDMIKTGSATRRLEVMGRQTFGTVDGVVETIRVRARFRLSLGATTVTNDSVVWIVPGGGALAESIRRVVRVLGVPVQEVREMEQEASSLGR